jgi:hypothetical protein
MRIIKAAAIIAALASASFVDGFDAAALAGATSTATVTAAEQITPAFERIYWTRRCNCRRVWVGPRRWTARWHTHRYWLAEHRHFWGDGCWRWRATHWGVARVWSC